MPAMSNPVDQRPGVRLTPEQERSRKARNIAIGLVIAALVVIFYLVTIVKLGPGVISGPT